MTPAHIRHAALTDQGRVRRRNEDAWATDPSVGLYVISDGMGGLPAGQEASRLVVDGLPVFFRRWLEEIGDDLPRAVLAQAARDMLRDFNETFREEAARGFGTRGMGATLVMAWISGERLLVGHLGDSRAYLLRAGELMPLTRDHSLVRYLVDLGEITPEQALIHPSRNQITQFAGIELDAVPDVEIMELEAGDRLLLCTDGLTGMLRDRGIAKILADGTPEDVCRKLVAAANQAGGHDNITVLVVEWGGPTP